MDVIEILPNHKFTENRAKLRVSTVNGTNHKEFDNTITLTIESGLSMTHIYLTRMDADNLAAALITDIDDLAKGDTK